MVSSSYDLQGRLATAVVDTYQNGAVVGRETSHFVYDAAGNRVSSERTMEADADGDPGTPLQPQQHTTTSYLNNGLNPTGYVQVQTETTRDAATSAVLDQLVYTLGTRVLAQAHVTPGSGAAGSAQVLLYDGRGSTRLLTAAGGAGLQTYAYDAYGRAVGFDPNAALTRLLYNGEQWDPGLRLQYLRARYYDPSTGRFTSLDPFAGNAANPLSLNKYLYTHGDPVNGRDPTGMVDCIEIMITMAFGESVDVEKAKADIQVGLNAARMIFSFLALGTWFMTALDVIPKHPVPAAVVFSAIGSTTIGGGGPASSWGNFVPSLFGNTAIKVGAGIDFVVFTKQPNNIYVYTVLQAGLSKGKQLGALDVDLSLLWGGEEAPDTYPGREVSVTIYSRILEDALFRPLLRTIATASVPSLLVLDTISLGMPFNSMSLFFDIAKFDSVGVSIGLLALEYGGLTGPLPAPPGAEWKFDWLPSVYIMRTFKTGVSFPNPGQALINALAAGGPVNNNALQQFALGLINGPLAGGGANA